jgi:hypothetical protein
MCNSSRTGASSWAAFGTSNVKGEGQFIDPTRNSQRDAIGKVILGTNSQPLLIATTALEMVQRAASA